MMAFAEAREQDSAAHHAPRDVIQDLWSAGYTIVRRQADPYHVDPKEIPRGMAYEWHSKWSSKSGNWREGMASDGWKFVEAARHDGVYAPVGYGDLIEVGDSVLMERPKVDVDKVHAAHVAKAHQNVTDWIERNGAAGFSGGVRMWTGDENVPSGDVRIVGDPVRAQKVIESTPKFGQHLTTPAPAPVRLRVPRHPALRWLYNLISTEQ